MGPVKVVCDDTTVFADEITWDEKTMRASGSVLVVQEGLRVTADRAEMDRATKLGTFYKAAGTARLTDKDIKPSMFGTLEPEVSFYAEKLEKLAPRKYRLTDGWFSTCLQANPRWDMRGSSGTITLDEYVLLKNAVLRVKGLPSSICRCSTTHSARTTDRPDSSCRATGVERPRPGISSSFFWAISRAWMRLSTTTISPRPKGAGGDYEFVSAVDRAAKSGCGPWTRRKDSPKTARSSVPRAGRAVGDMNQTLGRHFRASSIPGISPTSRLSVVSTEHLRGVATNAHFSGAVSGSIGRYRLAGSSKADFYTDPTTAQRTGEPRRSRSTWARNLSATRRFTSVRMPSCQVFRTSSTQQTRRQTGPLALRCLANHQRPAQHLAFLRASVSIGAHHPLDRQSQSGRRASANPYQSLAR